ncbi:MAG: lysophospholipid acyltransferase family protein, partial [Candidatus Adiutrix sp.]
MNFKNNNNKTYPLGVALASGLFIIFTWPLAWLPHRLGLFLGATVGKLVFHFSPRRRKIAIRNIEMVQKAGGLSQTINPKTTAKESFANMGRSGWETIKFFHRGLSPFLPYCRVEEGLEHLEKAVAQAKQQGVGLLIVTGHIGNWEIMCHYVGHRFTKMNIVGRSLGSPLADAIITRLRARDGNTFTFKSGGAKAMLTTLKRGEVLG